MNSPFTIGISGGSASGKTTFLNALMARLNSDLVCLVSQDNYYRPRHLQPTDDSGVQNFDTPNSIDFEQYANDLRTLQSGKTVERSEYTFNNPNIEPRLLQLNPAPIIIVEGIFVFYLPQISKLLDFKVFIDAQEHIKLSRRIKRDREERGYDLEDVLYRYERHVAPSYQRYIEPFKFEADVIIPNNESFDQALDMLVTYIKTKIK
ncbi:MAG TPA: uridine kinase [Cytophagales bacterium]|nr:uridine kinase [Cytophagales bacterium]HAA21199.1 uridine kinase [Cytophagales bacterium]HAP62112.1 uridine kinase [Cytophagales bacterium]